MLTEPRAGLLLARVSSVLEKTALSDMASPMAQRQLKAGLWVMRDMAARLDGQAATLREDIADMELLLTRCGAGLHEPATGDEVHRHQALQEKIAALEAGLYTGGEPLTDQGTAAAKALRALYLRMLERERAQLGAAPNGAGGE